MSIHGSKTAIIGGNIKLRCHTNLPVRDIDSFEWIKIGYDGNELSIPGVVHSNSGSYKLEITNASYADQGVYVCVVTYSLGEISQVEMKSIQLEISGMFVPNLNFYVCSSSALLMIWNAFIYYCITDVAR